MPNLNHYSFTFRDKISMQHHQIGLSKISNLMLGLLFQKSEVLLIRDLFVIYNNQFSCNFTQKKKTTVKIIVGMTEFVFSAYRIDFRR